jgi:thioredoxin 1
MQEPITLTDDNLEMVLKGTKPALILFSNGEGVRNEFSMAFKRAAGEHGQIVFAKLDTAQNPQAAARFGVGSKPVLVGWYGEEIVRRPRPWGSDVPLAVEMLEAAYKERNPVEAETEEMPAAPEPLTDDKPVVVTDATFEPEVLNHDKPVLVDFWAEWCGPCRMVAPILEKLAKEFAGQIRIAKVNVDENPGLAQAFRIMSIPNLMIIKQRTVIFNQPGALPEAPLRDLIKQAIALQIPAQKQPVK